MHKKISIVIVLVILFASFIYKQRNHGDETEFHLYIMKAERFDERLASIDALIKQNDSTKMRALINSYDNNLADKKNCKQNIFYKPENDKKSEELLKRANSAYEEAMKVRLDLYCHNPVELEELVAFTLLIGNQTPFCNFALANNKYEMDVKNSDLKLFEPCFKEVKGSGMYKIYTGSNDYFLNTIMEDQVKAKAIRAAFGTSFRIVVEEEEEHDDD